MPPNSSLVTEVFAPMVMVSSVVLSNLRLINTSLPFTFKAFSESRTTIGCKACTPTAPGNGINPEICGAALSITIDLLTFSDPATPDAAIGVSVAARPPVVATIVPPLSSTLFTLSFFPVTVAVESAAPTV